MRIWHRKAQLSSKSNFAEATEFTESISGKVAYKRIKEKVSKNGLSPSSPFSNIVKKAISEEETLLTEELMLTDSFYGKVAYEKDIGKVMEKSRQSIQNISKRYFVKM